MLNNIYLRDLNEFFKTVKLTVQHNTTFYLLSPFCVPWIPVGSRNLCQWVLCTFLASLLCHLCLHVVSNATASFLWHDTEHPIWRECGFNFKRSSNRRLRNALTQLHNSIKANLPDERRVETWKDMRHKQTWNAWNCLNFHAI